MAEIIVYAIAKNEAKHVYRWYDSVKEADAIVVVDTGSEDTTVSKLQKCANVHVHHYANPTFRFDHARNQALSHAMELNSTAIYVWCDLDEVLEKGWKAKLLAHINPDATAFNFIMVNGTITYNRLAAHSKHYRWDYPAHEVLTTDRAEKQEYTDIVVTHLPDENKPRDYLELLRIGAEEYNDARSCRYYARELGYNNRYEEAITFYEKALRKEESPLLECEIYIELGNCLWHSDKLEDAERSFLYAAWNAPYIREGWGALANFCFHAKMYDKAVSALHQMLYVRSRPEHTVMVFEPYYNEWPFHMLAVCYHALGNDENAKRYIAEAIALSPRDGAIHRDFGIINNLTFENLTITETR